MSTDFKKLQNGSDIRGISLTGIKGEDPNLTDVQAPLIIRGYLNWLSQRTGKATDKLTIAVGRDPRNSGPMLLHGVITGCGPYGTKVYDCGLATTPAMFMSTQFPETNCDGAIMITASHLPWNRNGFKFFDRTGGLQKKDISQILEWAASPEGDGGLGAATHPGSCFLHFGKKTWPSQPFDLMVLYTAHLRKIIADGIAKGSPAPAPADRPLEGMKICVDAGNGGGGFFATEVLAPLGADVSSSQYLEPDGGFPHHAPNPEDSAAMESISLQVLSTGSDLGLIFDTDVDRSAAVDSRGRPVARNGIVALAASLVAEDYPGSTIVTDSITSDHLSRFLEDDLGLFHFRYKRGYKNVINKALELNEAGTVCPLAIETSGHAAMKENYFLDDGAYLAARIVIKAALLAREGKQIDSLLDPLKQPAESREVRMAITAEDFATVADGILEDLKTWATGQGLTVVEPNYEGVRIQFPGGWCLLRKSLHDPLMPLNMESDDPGGVAEIAASLGEFLRQYPELDSSSLTYDSD